MRDLLLSRVTAAALLLATCLAGCGKLGLGGQPTHSHELPSPQQLKSIRYMSQAPGPDGRKIFNHLEQAKSCRDLEVAMRWDRPPDVRGGPFNKKMVYVTSRVPANLPKDSEVFVYGVIRQGQPLASGGSVWSLKLKDGSELQAVETAQYSDKQEEAQQAGGKATMVHPYTPKRILCAYGVYQGDIGVALGGHGRVPLVSVLFAMDRIR
jgi:hypothetical protein